MTYIKLNDLELIKRIDKDGATSEIRSVHNITIYGKRNVVELKIPGSKGNLFQDLGRDPITLKIDGKLNGEDSNETLNAIKIIFESGEPVAFSSDIGTLEEINKVVILNFMAQFIGGLPLGSTYSLLVREYSPPTQEEKSEGGAPSQEKAAKEDVDQKTKEVRERSKEETEGREKEEEDRENKDQEKRKEEQGEGGKENSGDERSKERGDREAGVNKTEEGKDRDHGNGINKTESKSKEGRGQEGDQETEPQTSRRDARKGNTK